MADAPATPQQIVRHLGDLGRELDALVKALGDAEIVAVRLRHAADMVESLAYVEAEGAVEKRKHLAKIASDTQESDALVAEAVVRNLRMQVRAVITRIDIGRSYGAAVRSELSALAYSETP